MKEWTFKKRLLWRARWRAAGGRETVLRREWLAKDDDVNLCIRTETAAGETRGIARVFACRSMAVGHEISATFAFSIPADGDDFGDWLRAAKLSADKLAAMVKESACF